MTKRFWMVLLLGVFAPSVMCAIFFNVLPILHLPNTDSNEIFKATVLSLGMLGAAVGLLAPDMETNNITLCILVVITLGALGTAGILPQFRLVPPEVPRVLLALLPAFWSGGFLMAALISRGRKFHGNKAE